ncbi:MAG: hypothetical protein WDO18_06810 [Acidobacteriota bacterium]
MLAVHLKNGRVQVRQDAMPRVPEGFARIRLLAAGICSTDLELQRGVLRDFQAHRGTNSSAKWSK